MDCRKVSRLKPALKAIVIGGGFAGLRAAVLLADQGIRVTLIEGRSSLGGRARSFTDPATGQTVDNGQHLFLADYRETIRFLQRLGTNRHLIFQDHLKVTFVEPPGRSSTLDCPKLPSPWHLLVGMARLSSFTLSDKLKLGRLHREIHRANRRCLDEESVEEWLNRMGQSRQSRLWFWHPLAVAALNEDPSTASAFGLVAVLDSLMRSPWPNARLGSSSIGLSDLYAEPARRVIEEQGGEVLLNCFAAGLEMEGSQVTGVGLADGKSLRSDAVISALPPAALLKIIPGGSTAADSLRRNLSRFRTSPIVSINLWLDRPVTQALFVGMIGTSTQWLFNKQAILAPARVQADYLSLIISAAHSFIGRSNDELISAALQGLRACFPSAAQARLIRSQVVRERDATVSLTVGMEKFRPGPATAFDNLFLAGDWTDTGLPATIESAVVSGRKSAELLIKQVRAHCSERESQY